MRLITNCRRREGNAKIIVQSCTKLPDMTRPLKRYGRLMYCLIFSSLFHHTVYGQQDLQKQLEHSRYLQITMKADSADAGITRWSKKKIEAFRDLPLAADLQSLHLRGPGSIRINNQHSISGKGSVMIETPTSLAVKNPSNRSYASAELVRPLQKENLTDYN